MSKPGVVLAIHLLTVHRQPPIPVTETAAVVGGGLEGDVHGKGRLHASRQVLIAERRSLEAFDLPHGALKEQLTVDLPGLDELPGGTRLRVGEALLELTGPCEPCQGIARSNHAADPYAFRDALRGRRGMLAKVVAVTGVGRIRRGDQVTIESPVQITLPVER